MRKPAQHSTTRRIRPAVQGTPKPRTGGRSARVVAEVLSATLEIFGEQGYAGLSVEAVAARARVNKTTIYRRWPTKAELVAAALFSLRDADPEPPDAGTLQQDLQIIVEHWAEQLASPRKRAAINAVILSGADPELQALVQRMREERPIVPHVVYERAFKRKELPKGSDTQLLTSALLGPVYTRVYLKRETVDRAFIRQLIKLVIAGAAAGGALH